MMRLWRNILFSVVFLGTGIPGAVQANDGQAPVRNNTVVQASENTPRFSSQSHSRIRTTVRGADGKSVPVEISVRLQSQGTGEALLTLVRDGAPGDLVLALPDTMLSSEDLRDFVSQEGAGSDLRFTTIGALRAGDHGSVLSLRHGAIRDSTPAILLRRAGTERLEARLQLRETARLGRILVTLGGASGWTEV